MPLEADETNSRLKRTQASPCLSLERRTELRSRKPFSILFWPCRWLANLRALEEGGISDRRGFRFQRRFSRLLTLADNTAALAAIFDRKPTAGQAHAERFRRYAKAFPDRDPGNTIDIDWSPGHEDIRGNLRKQQQRCGAPTRPRRSRTRNGPRRTRP